MTKPRDRFVEGIKAGTILATTFWLIVGALYIFFAEGILG